jgi:hypothetical protein
VLGAADADGWGLLGLGVAVADGVVLGKETTAAGVIVTS